MEMVTVEIQFIYDIPESKASNMECYSVYDFKDNNYIYDAKSNKTVIAIDRQAKLIYFFGMNSGNHYIIDKMYYFKIINQFLSDKEAYAINDEYIIDPGCTGGEIYYKYNIYR